MARKKSKKVRIKHTKLNRMYPAFLNFFVWGLGYVVDNRTALGTLWIAAYIPMHIAWWFTGWGWIFTTQAGLATLLGHLIISFTLALDGFGGKGKKRY